MYFPTGAHDALEDLGYVPGLGARGILFPGFREGSLHWDMCWGGGRLRGWTPEDRAVEPRYRLRRVWFLAIYARHGYEDA